MISAHGGQLRALAASLNVPASTILDFSVNINPEGPPAAVTSELRRALEDPCTLTSYPDLALHDLRVAISEYIPCLPESISVANGFVPLLEAAVRTSQIRRCVLPVPCFSEYRASLERCGVTIIPYALEVKRFSYDLSALLTLIREGRADAICIANPQNPSGLVTSASFIRELVRQTPETCVLLDEAFIDYIPEESLTFEAASSSKLYVFRSVTKFFAMPGLRVAYVVGHPDNITRLSAALAPWPVTTLAARAVPPALGDALYHRNTRVRNADRRAHLKQSLEALGIGCYPAAANFLLLQIPVPEAPLHARLLRDYRILLRSCSNFESLSVRHLRTAVRLPDDNDRLLAALSTIL